MVGFVGSLIVLLFKWRQGANLPAKHRATHQHMLWFLEFCFRTLVLAQPLTQKLACPVQAGEDCRVFPCRTALWLCLGS